MLFINVHRQMIKEIIRSTIEDVVFNHPAQKQYWKDIAMVRWNGLLRIRTLIKEKDFSDREKIELINEKLNQISINEKEIIENNPFSF